MTLSFFASPSSLRLERLAAFAAVGLGLGAVAACSSSSSTSGTVPPGAGLTCGSSTNAADTAAANTAIASAPSGTCIVLSAGVTYTGPLKVPAGVALVAQNGARAIITGGTAQEPAVSLGEGGGIVGIDVVDAGGVGIAIRGANALVSDVTVRGTKNAALAVQCKESVTPGCTTGTVLLDNVSLTKSSLGLWVSGAHVIWTRGGSSGHESTSLTAAAGVIAQDGARLELDNVTVEKNQGVGVLVDGAATTASVKDSTVNENGERGIWGQRLGGTIEAPALKIQGSQITKNKIVGVGAMESRGIIIVSGRVADTIASPQVTNLASTELVGDGVGVFAGSGDIKVDGTTFDANARAAGVIDDGSDRGIIIVSGKLGGGGTGLKFVVQNTKSDNVQIPEADRSVPPKALGISAPKLSLPPVL